MITSYYIYTRAGGEGKEEGRTGRERGAMESRRTGQKKGGGLQGMRREDFKRGKAPHPTFF